MRFVKYKNLSLLPNGYTRLEYIQNSGTQWISTGYAFTSTTSSAVELKFMVNSETIIDSLSTYNCVSGCETSERNHQHDFALRNGELQVWHQPLNGYFRPTILADTEYTIKGEWNENTYYFTINGVTYSEPCIDHQLSPSPYGLFTDIYNQEATVVCFITKNEKIFHCKIWDDNVLVRHLIPARRDLDGELGMYDLVTNTFFTNRGTGVFTAGPEVIDSNIMRFVTYKNLPLLPNGYTRLEYLQSTLDLERGIEPCISTGFVATTLSEVEVVYNLVQTGGQAVVSSGFDTSEGIVVTHWASGPSLAVRFGNSSYIPESREIDYDLTKFYKVNINRNRVIINDSITYTFNDPHITTIYQTFLFKNIWGDQNSSIKVKSFKMWDDGVLVRELIPARRDSDNELGMYDLVTKQFLTNAGSGNFTAGPEVIDNNLMRFNDNKQIALLPAEYKQVEYLQSYGVQYINTGWYLPSDKDNFELKVDFQDVGVQTGTWAKICGVDIGSNGETQYYLIQFRGVREPDCIVAHNTDNDSSVSWYQVEGTRNKMIMSYNNGVTTITKNGTDVRTLQDNIDDRGLNPCFLFAGSKDNGTTYVGTMSSIKMYSFSISVDGIYQRNYIPVVRVSDNKPGMYDLVTKQFYVNANTEEWTDEFIAGPEVI